MIDEPLAFLAEAFGGELDPALEFELRRPGGDPPPGTAAATAAGPVRPARSAASIAPGA